MGGRPTVVGLVVAAVTVLCAGEFATSPATAEIRVPLPGSDSKPRFVQKRHPFPPTLPSRNPTRVTARIFADTIPLPNARDSEALVVVGTASSASVALALAPASQPTPPTVEAADDGESETASLETAPEPDVAPLPEAKPESAEAPQLSSEDTDATAEVAADEPATDEPGAEIESVEMAEAETPAEPEVDGAPTGAVETAALDAQAAAEVEAEPVPAPQETASTNETASVDSAPANETADEPADDAQPARIAPVDTPPNEDETPVESIAAGDTDPVNREKTEIAAVEPPEPVKEPPEPNNEDEAEQANAASKPEVPQDEPDAAKTDEPITSQDAAETGEPEAEVEVAAIPPQDASVVLEISPPPDEALTISAEPAADASDTANADAVAENTDTEEIEVAVLTAVSPAPDEALAISAEPAADTSDIANANADAAEENTVTEETEEIEVAALTPASPAPAPAPAEEEESVAPLDTAPSEDEKTADEGPSNDVETPGAEESAAEESVAEEVLPPPPPAHPVVAEVRASLAEPGQYKTAAKSDLAALTALYGAHEGPPLWITDEGFSDKAKAIMKVIARADDWGLEASSFDLPSAGDVPSTEREQAAAEIKLSIAILNYARDAQIGRLTPSRVSKLFDQHPKLRAPKKVLTEMADADAPDEYLTSLHPQHAEFRRLQRVLVRARDSAKATGRDPSDDRRVQLIVINMERWRWLPRPLGNYYVWNNVPEFNTRVLKNGRTIYEEKTIVGQYKYATPFFSAPMRNIVFHPNWTVPPTIIREDLAPKLKGPGGGGFFNSSKDAMLRRYGLKVSYKGQRISADSVDWNKVNVHAYTFTQDPGPANVLGQFKFNFPNKHAIYMHDTPQRELFAERTRTLSHGCIRVRQPDRLAALLLAEDKGWSMAQVRNVLAGNESKVISFKRRVPVHLTYFTAVADENGALSTFGDIYGIDNRMAAQLFDNPARFPVPAASNVADSGQGTRGRSRPRGRNGFDNFISGLFGN